MADFTGSSGDDQRAAARWRLLEGLRTFGGNYIEFTRRFAAWLGLHSTDAVALVEILFAEDKGAPLSPARLSERIHLTSGATTILIDRLEKAGYVSRSREHADRRRVTLRASPDLPAGEFFEPFLAALDTVISSHPQHVTLAIDEFLGALRKTMDRMLDEEYSSTGTLLGSDSVAHRQ